MPRYGFTSPGSQAGDAIQKFLVERALQQRQQQMDAQAKQEQQQQAAQQASELQLRQQQEQRIGQAQSAQMADLEQERQFRRAGTIAENAMPGDPADETTRTLLQSQGYGGQLNKVPGIVAQGAFQGNDAQDIPQYDVTHTPDSYTMRGGSKYLSARAAADERAAAAADAQTAREDEAARQREFQAGQNDLTRQNVRAMAGGQRGLQDELTRLRIDQERNKMDAASQAKADAGKAVAGSRAEVRDLAQSLLDDPALDAITGPVAGRVPAWKSGADVDAKRRLDQVVGKLTLESRGKMKGQGQISDFEGRLLANAVSAIDRAAGPEIVKKHLQEIVDAFSGDTPKDSTATAGTGTTAPAGTGGGSSFRVVRKH